jgi:hypothetical protein
MLPDDCDSAEPVWLPLLWLAELPVLPAVLPVLLCPALLEVSGDCEDEGVLCATIHAEQANRVKLSKIVFVIGKHSSLVSLWFSVTTWIAA